MIGDLPDETPPQPLQPPHDHLGSVRWSMTHFGRALSPRSTVNFKSRTPSADGRARRQHEPLRLTYFDGLTMPDRPPASGSIYAVYLPYAAPFVLAS
jgi:hypothetical protein